MKVRLEKTGLIITPESYVEQVALNAWSDKSDLSNGGWLVEAYAQHGGQADLLSRCANCGEEKKLVVCQLCVNELVASR